MSFSPADTTQTQSRNGAPRSTLLLVLGWLNLAIPVVAAIFIFIRTAVNIPFDDDYDCIGYAMEFYSRLHGFFPKAQLVLTSQHTQYKLMFLHAVVAIQYELIHHINYEVLQYIGDASVFGVLLVLWFLLARSGRPLSQRVWLFTLPCYVYLALRYYQTVNWAMSGLQNMMIVPFAAATILFVTSKARYAFFWCMFFLLLSIGTSGNGFFAAVVVLAFLVWRREYLRLTIALGITVGMAALYAYHNVVYSVASRPSFALAVERFLLFPLVFLGSATGRARSAAVLGLILLCAFVWLTLKGWWKVCPGSFGVALFCIITMLGVDLTRYSLGYQAAVQGRYYLYGLLLVALLYIGMLRLYVPPHPDASSRWRTALWTMIVAAILFAISSDIQAYQVLSLHKRELITHLILWERHPDHLVLSPDEDPGAWEPHWIPVRARFQQEMTREIAMGLYIPPYTAQDSLPIRTHSRASVDIENEGHPQP